MEEAGWVNRMGLLLNVWEIRAAVVSSFVAHILLILLAGIRRRRASGARVLILWVAYQFSSWVAPYALSNLSLCGDTSRRQQLVAFWATFLLHHLGGPDNISALSREDNELSRRELLTAVSRIGGASYVLYKHVYLGGGGKALIRASIIIFVLGAAKYVERAMALWQADFRTLRSSSKKKQATRFFTVCAGSESLIRMGIDYEMEDEEALMVAHDMLPFCMRAMADSSVDTESPDLVTSRKIFTLRWENMCNVVEMELSLMYDVLYTKATVVHTSTGYGIRVASPLAIGAATVLFGWYYNKEGQSIADVIITYSLLLATLLLDTRWLLRALGSTWTHAFLQASRPRRWLYHAVLCSGRWRRLRYFVVSLDLGRLHLTARPRCPSSYRRWSGKVGKYNLLQECTPKTSACGRTVKKIGLEDVWKKYQHSKGSKLSQDVKRVVFTRVSEVLRETYEKAKGVRYTMKDITTSWGQVTVKRRHKELEELRLAFGHEFQEDILVWHIATQVFLIRSHQSQISHDKNVATHAKAIKELSEYLMFLVAMRPAMLPGLPLRSLYEEALKCLQELDTSGSNSSSATREEKVAEILVNRKKYDYNLGFGRDIAGIVYDGANIAIELLTVDESKMPELLELVFNVWVDKLLYAATKCSPESHAKQLSRGGDLTTIVWIMAQHAGPFRIGHWGPDADDDDEMQQEKTKPKEKKKPEEKKPEPKKKPEEKPKPKKEEKKPEEKKPDEKMEPVASPWVPARPPAALPTPPMPEDTESPKPPRRDRRRKYATLYPVD